MPTAAETALDGQAAAQQFIGGKGGPDLQDRIQIGLLIGRAAHRLGFIEGRAGNDLYSCQIAERLARPGQGLEAVAHVASQRQIRRCHDPFLSKKPPELNHSMA
jgi:hypothetical protein